MKRMFFILSMLAITFSMSAQPILPKPVNSQIERYNPPLWLPSQKGTYKQSSKKKLFQRPLKMKATAPIVNNDTLNRVAKDSIFVKKDTVTTDYFVYNKKVNENKVNANTTLAGTNIPYEELKRIKASLIVHDYKSKGWTKILAGGVLQLGGLGLVAYANTDKISTRTVTETRSFDYTYPVYETATTQQTVTNTTTVTIPGSTYYINRNNGNPFGHNKDHGRGHAYGHYKDHTIEVTTPSTTTTVTTTSTVPVTNIISHNETKTVTYTDTDRVTEKHQRNKAAYYTAAGIAGVAGLALEIWGGIDLHKAHVYATHNSVGLVIKF